MMKVGKRMKHASKIVIVLDVSVRLPDTRYFGGFKPQVAAKPEILSVELENALVYSMDELKTKVVQDLERLRIRGFPKSQAVAAELTLKFKNTYIRTCAGP